ncbi:MAG: hypothetical protein JWR80_2801 [Bradyrhizobium sp.]|nr:hypothetical protein [Bradyrhizobium sp.]
MNPRAINRPAAFAGMNLQSQSEPPRLPTTWPKSPLDWVATSSGCGAHSPPFAFRRGQAGVFEPCTCLKVPCAVAIRRPLWSVSSPEAK